MSNPAPRLPQGSPLALPDDEASAGRAMRQMFAAVAPRYDFLNHLLSLGRDIAWRRATAKALREVLARPGSLAADVCCGTGDMALALARYSAGKVIGTDFCRAMLLRAQRKAWRSDRPLFLAEADALALPFRDGSFDVVSVAFGLRNVGSRAAGLRELRRVLKPGGTVAILEFSHVRSPVFGPLFRFYSQRILPRLGTWISGVPGAYQYLPDSVSQFPDQESLAAVLPAAGFVNVRYRNFTGGVAALHLAEKR
jgi:demethylmenaquinone methyltransferase/2-methoxy-6-polyprenyl-1,4-benzoquinol methylase